MEHPPGTERLRIAMIGTRGVPAAYGGFETAVEEIGARLVDAGHEVIVYCRDTGSQRLPEYRGMKLVYRPALRMKAAETLSHTAFSVVHTATHHRPDAAFVFNAANAPFLPLLRARGIPTAVHMDGLEWKRDKWGASGRRYYRWAEEFAVKWGDALIADARGIADYYRDEFHVPTELIAYGARVLTDVPSDLLEPLGLPSGGFHLVVARFEPENHVDMIVEGYRRSSATLPLVVVGSAPYAADYTQHVRRLAQGDPRIRLMGSVFDQPLLDQLYAHAVSYLHGHSVGGTNPSLLRAMGAATEVIAFDVDFNREVSGAQALYFDSPAALAPLIESVEADLEGSVAAGVALQERATARYDWDDVATAYEALAVRLVQGHSTAGASHPRSEAPAWNGTASVPSGGAGVAVSRVRAR